MENCLGCKFFYQEKRGENLGLCRRFPCTWTNDARGFEFPVMKIIGWCGEWQKKAPKEEPK